MTAEKDVLQRLRKIATHEAAHGLADDTAVLGDLVITHDSIAEEVHFLGTDPPSSVGWKLVAVNLSDLAAKGATPEAALLSLTLSDDSLWDSAFIDGVEAACESYGLALIGGDTIALPPGGKRVFGMTAIGRAGPNVPLRSGGRDGDKLWLVGTLGDSAAGLRQLTEKASATGPLVDIYRRPVPLLAVGEALAPHANAMMDVSDGLLLDVTRLAEASGCGAAIHLDRLPLSAAYVDALGDDRDSRLFAATGGDDYALLAALPPDFDPLRLSLPIGTRLSEVGRLAGREPHLKVLWGGEPVPLPELLGHEHRRPVTPMADRV